jgi:glycosyltransferase involved in cell wall biosynthesis
MTAKSAPDPESRILYLAIQSRLRRGPDGVVRSSVGYARYDAWLGFLGPFDEIVLVTRVEASPTTAGFPVEGPGVRIAEAPYFRGPFAFLRTLQRQRRWVREQLLDRRAVYGSRMPNLLGTLVAWRARRLGAPFLAQLVGDPEDVLRSEFPGPLGSALGRLSRWHTRRELSRADAAIYVTRRTLQAKYPASSAALTLARSNVVLSESSFAASPRTYEEPLGRLTVISVGSHETRYKGHDLLVSGLARLIARGFDIGAVIIGDGKHNARLRRQAIDEGVADRVTFLGALPGAEDVRAELAKADLYVLASRQEGLPRALIEAMACGIVCIGADVGGTAELLDAEHLFRPGDVGALVAAIERTIADPRRMSEAAHRQWEAAREVAATHSGDERLRTFLEGFIERLALVDTQPS